MHELTAPKKEDPELGASSEGHTHAGKRRGLGAALISHAFNGNLHLAAGNARGREDQESRILSTMPCNEPGHLLD